MKDSEIGGIYLLINIINNKKYVGNGKRTPDSFKLKYTKDLGFDFIIKK